MKNKEKLGYCRTIFHNFRKNCAMMVHVFVSNGLNLGNLTRI